MIEIERMNLFEEKPRRKQGRNPMVRFPNLINRGLFRLKGYADDTDNKRVDPLRDIREQRKGDIISTATGKTSAKKDIQNLADSEIVKSSDEKVTIEVNDLLESKNAFELREEIRSLKRAYLYQENNLIENWEQEKVELREQYEDERTRLKKAFVNDKVELLKEIERKDKMLEKLAEVLKAQHQKNMDDFQANMEKQWDTCFKLHVELMKCVETAVENTRKIVVNNESTFGNLDEFKSLQEHQFEMCTLLREVKKSPLTVTNEFSLDKNEPDLSLVRSISNPVGKTDSAVETISKSLRESKAKSVENMNHHDDDIQHEMAEVYRQQKTLLVNLFNTEKEEDRKRLSDEKKRFERDVRTEYDSRMIVERKAWQETIEDLEREINILRYEREQLDRNYCLGMDEMKTEFEIEKQQLYRRFSETQHMYEKKIKEFLCNTKNLES